nr:SH3 domain-containing protein [uncultured Flavobacterium sp.]
MYKYLIFLFLILISCKSESQESLVSITELKTAYLKKDDLLFIKKFPKNYKQFVSYFGWNESLDKPNPLYNESEKYINLFFLIVTKKENKESLKLIVDIGINGKYQADAVSYFRRKTEELFIQTPNLACNLLKNRNIQEVDSFWHYYFDSPQPTKVIPKYFSNLTNECNSIYKSIDKQIKLIQNENVISEVTSISQTNKLKKITDFIPKDYFVLDSLSGYINKDNFQDKIIILASEKEYKNNTPRTLIILINDGIGGYVLKIKNQNVIPCLRCSGGTGGEDSYNDLLFNKNLFSFTQLRINDSELIENKYTFQIIEGEVILDNVIISKSGLYNDKVPKERKTINNLKVNISDFNYNDFKNNFTIRLKIADPDGYTNLRKEKNSTSSILEKVKTGEFVEVIKQSGGWYLVKTKSGKEGYIFKTKTVSE